MAWQIEIREQAAQPTLYIRAHAPTEGLPKLIGESFHRIAAYLAELGEGPAYGPYVCYRSFGPPDIDAELGFPLFAALPGRGDIIAGELPAGPVATCLYRGPYSEIGAIYQQMRQWIADHGYEACGYYEYYLNSPDEVPESELMTRVDMTVKPK